MDDHDNRPQRSSGRDLFAWAALLAAVATLIDAVRAWW